MLGYRGRNYDRIGRQVVAALIAVVLPAILFFNPAQAARDERELYLHYTHTGETVRVTFWRDGKFDKKGLAELNQFLRDWRNGKPTKMDPNLFNLLWQVYRDVGGSQPIHIVSSYRSPESNAMLAARSSGVAKNSRHMRGEAMDFYIPGVPLDTLRAAAMKRQVGGVGFYPTSGSPFVHLDTGSVRAWPRMSRSQLARLFPDGRTLHLPADGTPLSGKGRQYAEAEWNKCRTVPCNGAAGSFAPLDGYGTGAPIAVTERTLLAAAPTPPNRPSRFTNVPEVLTDQGVAAPAFDTVFALASVNTIAPVPPSRPGGLTPVESALPDLPAATLPPARPEQVPVIDFNDNAVLAAYAPAPLTTGRTEAQRALELLIDQANEEAVMLRPPLRQPVVTASITPAPQNFDPVSTLGGLLDALTGPKPARLTPAEFVGLSLDQAAVDFEPPDFEHAAMLMSDPTPVTDAQYGVMFEPGYASFDPAATMGEPTFIAGFGDGELLTPDAESFNSGHRLLLAHR